MRGPVKRSDRAPRAPHAARWIGLALALLLAVLPGLARGGSLAERIDGLVRESAGLTPITRDTGALDVVASWAAREAFGGRSDAAALRHQLWAAGLRDFEFRPLTVVARGADPLAALRSVLADPGIRWDRFTHFAVSSVQRGGRTAVSVLLTRRAVRFAGDPEQGTLALDLLPSLDRPALFVTRPDGEVERFDAVPLAEGWRIEWAPGELPGELLLEVVAQGPRGPEVAALWRERRVPPAGRPSSAGALPDPNDPFPGQGRPAWDPYEERAPAHSAEGAWIVGAGETPDRSPRPEDAMAAEDHLWRLIQNARVARDLPALSRNVAMTRAARQHAGEIARGEPFGHHTSSGTALDRLTAHGVPASRATENVALASHVAEAHAALMASPAHRANLLDAGVQDGAVGVVLQRDARGRWSAVVSEVFARPLPRGGAERWAELALDAINAERRRQTLPELRTRDRLTELAQEAAEAVVASQRIDLPAALRDELVGRVRFHFNAVGRVSVDLMVTTEPARAGRLAHVLEEAFDELGIGVATLPQGLGEHPAGAPVIVLLFVQR